MEMTSMYFAEADFYGCLVVMGGFVLTVVVLLLLAMFLPEEK